ncbi:CHASE2 domain-containing protein [Comamonas thiooxydans]|uniref:CHASE2 domain-containing protein n=1 Tax=Comamonas thiooxydans TaxID=363952 RepID=UPI0001BB102B|nr:CHASE2 domain-containing protein [Comamonas thiooxydans]ACY31575.1 periplasmic sensor signal transduction [Comamonas thiooxydans]MDO1472847.1 CHASE2 domain-containing protein [Comamonas thiooxydans]
MVEAPNLRKNRLQDLRLSWLLLSAFLLGMTWWLSGPGQLARFNGIIQDTSAWLHQRPASPDVVIVAIDDDSIDSIGRWPWRRALHAAVLERITQGQPRAIGMDVVFSEEDWDYPGDDLLLQRALQKSGNVVLPVTRAAQSAATTPLQSLASEAAALGHTQMPVDADGVVRRFYAQEGKAGQLWWHMALSLHCVGQTTQPCQPSAPPPADSVAANSWQKLQPQFIAFARASRDRQNSPGSPFTTYSYIDILRGNIPAVAFRGKYVLIGATAAGLGEKFTAPIGFDARLISNVEMLGHVLNGILEGTHLEPATATLNRSLNVLPVLLGLLALAWLGPSGGLISSILLALLSLSIAGLAPRWGHVQTAPAAALLSLSLAYPLWSWLRLRAATRFLALELRDLQGQGLPAPSLKSDALDQRIDAVEQASRQLRALHHFVSESLRQLPSATFVCDREGLLLLANTAAHRYIESLEHKLQQGDDLVALLHGLNSASSDGGRAASSTPLLTHSALQQATLSRQSEGRDTQGRHLMLLSQSFEAPPTSGWLITLVDISDLRSAQAQRDQAMQFISHDIRAPIGSIITLLEMQRTGKRIESQDALFDRIEGYAQSSLQLADDFVHLARAQQQQYRSEVVDLGLLADQAVSDCWTLAQQQNMRLVFELPDAEACVHGDPGLLNRAVINLLSNAIKYGKPPTGDGGAQVEVAVVEQDSQWGIAVRDHGSGMDEASLARLSQPFERLQQHQRMDGVGLGLAFTRTVAQRHGGSLQISSQLGQGSSFTLLIPKA